MYEASLNVKGVSFRKNQQNVGQKSDDMGINTVKEREAVVKIGKAALIEKEKENRTQTRSRGDENIEMPTLIEDRRGYSVYNRPGYGLMSS